MAFELDEAFRQLVRQCCRLQTTGYDHIRTGYQPLAHKLMVALGLRHDDLIPEENDTVQLALKRLPPKEAYDRVFRLRRAFQVLHQSCAGQVHRLTVSVVLACPSIITSGGTDQT
jgi:hypothetical protein